MSDGAGVESEGEEEAGEGMNRLVIRADAGAEMGTGHVMRCLALAQAWLRASGSRAGGAGPVLFVSASLPEPLELRVAAERCAVARIAVQPGSAEDAERTIEQARKAGAAWVVLDGYSFDPSYQARITESGSRLLVVDDVSHFDRYPADILLNQNLYADASLYEGKCPRGRRLLGSRYALLRREFLDTNGWARSHPDVARRLLISLGGGDSENVTRQILGGVAAAGPADIEVRVVVGAAYPHGDELAPVAQGLPFPCAVRRNVADMAAEMRWADVAILGGGSSVLEASYLQLPSLLTILADNQVRQAEQADSSGMAVLMGWWNRIDDGVVSRCLTRIRTSRDLRVAMARRMSEHVDGRGGERVAEAMRQAATGPLQRSQDA
jgi:UDP-2,4-diacetamido-2,4,6-trideoxy-beta-L-altropyranose hydrolase